VGGSPTSAGGSAASTGVGAASTGVSSSTSGPNGAATAGGSKTAATGSDSRAYTPTPLAQARASGQALQTGLREGPFHEERFNDEMEQAQAREDANPVTTGEARAALAALPRDTQQAVGQLASKHGEDARPYLADQATKDGWWPEEREAMRTLTAATPEVRSQALQEAQTDGWITNEPTGSMSDGAGGESSAAPTTFEGHSTDPRPIDDGVTGAGDTASSTPPPSEAPWPVGPAGGQPNTRPPDEAGGVTSPPPAREGTTAPSLPPAREGTNAPPPREPKDPDPNRN